MNSRKTVAQIQCWRISLWVLVGIGITIVGALLPARVRLFGIFPFLLGGGVGLAGESARGALSGELFSTKRFVLPVLISICVWGGQQGIQYHRYHRAISEAIANDPSAGAALALETGFNAQLAEERRCSAQATRQGPGAFRPGL